MTKTRRGARIVLDTSCVRGISRDALRMLKERGFEIHISGLALSEVAVHFASPVSEPTPSGRNKLRDRIRFLSGFFGGVVPLAPTHAALVDKLGGRVEGISGLRFRPWLLRAQATWSELAGTGDQFSQILSFVQETADYVTQSGEDFVNTVSTAAAFGEPSENDIAIAKRISKFIPSIVDQIYLPNGVSPAERFDAYTRVQELHLFRAYDRSVGRLRAAEPNHAVDINLLQHLAEGLLLVTRDYELIEDVDASGSVQSPWVRTIGELILGRYPIGLPFGYGALVARRKHHARKRTQLARYDQEGESLMREWAREHACEPKS